MNPLYSLKDEERCVPITLHSNFPAEQYRTAWRRDYARLIHCPAFRRLQGKTQLFHVLESDFFRNRLTHSLEVAQIAESIAIRINNTVPFFKKNPINLDIVRTAALAHDLGHPPFGHNGERALNDCMRGSGGFEGNAQTLRVLGRLEKRELEKRELEKEVEYVTGVTSTGKDVRVGLNFTYRTLASILKYDRRIPKSSRKAKPVKGYYLSEESLVKKVKSNVLNGKSRRIFKTIECSIMDISDDIAYSIYDLEDAFKAGFITPLDMLSCRGELVRKVASKVREAGLNKFRDNDVTRVLALIFKDTFANIPTDVPAMAMAAQYHSLDKTCSSNGYVRSELTSQLVTEFIHGVNVDVDFSSPVLSRAYLEDETLEKVEVLKHFTYERLVMSPMLKVAEYRGYDIVKAIFKALNKKKGHLLLPDDFQRIFYKVKTTAQKKRVTADFIAGMTDRYAIEFYGRLTSENALTIFKPL